jgi:hypothetical protein
VAAREVSLPATSAAAPSGGGGDPQALRTLASELALELESRRRALTLGGSLLLIPACGGVVLAGAGALGVPMVMLPVCLLIGLSIGPALTTASLALGNLIGAPGARAIFCRHVRALGIPAEDAGEIWREAVLVVDARARERLLRGTRAAQKTIPEGSP